MKASADFHPNSFRGTVECDFHPVSHQDLQNHFMFHSIAPSQSLVAQGNEAFGVVKPVRDTCHKRGGFAVPEAFPHMYSV